MTNLNLGFGRKKKTKEGQREDGPSCLSILCKAKQLPDPATVSVLNWAAETFKSLVQDEQGVINRVLHGKITVVDNSTIHL